MNRFMRFKVNNCCVYWTTKSRIPVPELSGSHRLFTTSKYLSVPRQKVNRSDRLTFFSERKVKVY